MPHHGGCIMAKSVAQQAAEYLLKHGDAVTAANQARLDGNKAVEKHLKNTNAYRQDMRNA